MGFITESLFSNQSCNVSQKGVKQVTGNLIMVQLFQKISLKNTYFLTYWNEKED